MKKIFTILGVIGILMSSCSKMENQTLPASEEEGVYTEITASIEGTRTSVDNDWKTTWDNDDVMTVYYTRRSNPTYGYSNFKYTKGTAQFTGSTTGWANSPKWFAVYPSTVTGSGTTSDNLTPKITHPAVQTMTGTSNAHIAANDPVFGYVVTGTQTPVIQMKHTATVLDFKITNGAKSAIKVTKIEFTAPQNIVGDFTATGINLKNASGKIEPTWTNNSTSATYKTVTLTVNNGTEIAAKDTAHFYAAIHPISAAKGNYTIKVTATMGGKTVTSTKTINTTLTFAAGTRKLVNHTFAPYVKVESAPTDWTGTYLIVDESSNNAFAYDKSGYKTSVTINKTTSPYTIAWSEDIAKYEVTVSVHSSSDKTHYDVKTSDGKYLYRSDSGTILNEYNSSYYAKIGELGMVSLGTKRSGGTEYFFRYNSNAFSFSNSSSNRIQLYKLQ